LRQSNDVFNGNLHQGFQGTDPASDVRGGGQLCLECIAYFLENAPTIAQPMLDKRDRKFGDGTSYPWATAGIALCRMLAVMFGVITVNGAPVRTFEKKSYWHLLRDVEDFFRLFNCAFVLLDRHWQAENATYMEYPRIQKLTEQQLSNILARMPHDMTEIERAIEPALREPLDYMYMPTDEDDEQEHGESPNEQIYNRDAQASRTELSEDLLFFDVLLADLSSPQPSSRQVPVADLLHLDVVDSKAEPPFSDQAPQFWLDCMTEGDLLPLQPASALRYRYATTCAV
jgi:hypothetical protein